MTHSLTNQYHDIIVVNIFYFELKNLIVKICELHEDTTYRSLYFDRKPKPILFILH